MTHDEPDWERIERETAERERAELAKDLPVDPVKLPDGFQPTGEPGVFTKTVVAERERRRY